MILIACSYMWVFYVLFLVLLTLAEIFFSLLYYCLTWRLDPILLVGFTVYLGCVIVVTLNYRLEAYRVERRKMLESLLS